MFLLGFHNILAEDTNSIIGIQIFITLIIPKFRSKLVPFHIIFYALFFHQKSQIILVDLSIFILLFFFFHPKTIEKILESILFVYFIQDSPSWICHKIICYFMHFCIRYQEFCLFQHFDKLNLIDFSFGLFLHLVEFFQISNILVEEFLFLTNPNKFPSLIILTHLDTRFPLGINIDTFGLKKCHKFSFLFLLFRQFLFELNSSI